MADNILLECARKFDEISDYNYLFTIGKKQRITINISLACARKDFTHTVGLDHLSDIKELSSKKASIKLSAFENILNNKLTYDKISSSEFFRLPFPDTYNSRTRLEYALIDRITALKDISVLLDTAYKGKFYKWNETKSYVKMPDNKIKHCSVEADYMLAVPSLNNNDENIYFFMYESKPKGDGLKQLNIFSAFPDCLDLSQGQEHPFTILLEEKVNVKTNETTVLFEHHNYKQKSTL